MRLILILIFQLSSLESFSKDKDCIEHVKIHPELAQLENISNHLQWNAANDAEIKASFCSRKNIISEDEMNCWLKKNQSASNVSKVINGIKFENESIENLKSFEYLTNAVSFLGQPDLERQKIFNSKCKKVDCAVKEIFGNIEGIQLLFMHRKYGMNGSHLAREFASNWRKDELDVILLSLTDYPDGVLPFEENRRLVHFLRGRERSEGTVANALIEIFDLWNKQTPEQKRYTLTHELGHALASVTHLDDSKKWMDLSGWDETTKIVDGKKEKTSNLSKPEAMISKYGETNQAEDFAESVAAYRYNPKKLKEASPEKYNLIKELIFDNVEYTSEEVCKNPKRTSVSVQEKVSKAINEWEPSPQDLSIAASKCSEAVIVKLSSNDTVNLSDSEFQSCYENALNDQAKIVGLILVETLPNKEFLAPMIKNIKLPSLQPDKLKAMVNDVQSIHRANLRTVLIKGFQKDFFFSRNSPKEKLAFIYQDFDKKLGFDAFSKREEFKNMAYRASQQIDKNSSIRRLLNLDFSESEIIDQVNNMIK